MNERLSLSCQAISSSHVFGPEGGVFGRSRKCDWVLPDEERILSSVHGRIILRDGIFSLVDESTNGIVLTGQTDPLGRGNSVAVRDGMSFMAGRYLIEARLVSTDSQAAAFGSPQSQAAPVANTFAQPSAQAPTVFGAYPQNQGVPLEQPGPFSPSASPSAKDPLNYLQNTPQAPQIASADPQQTPQAVNPLLNPQAAVMPGQQDPYAPAMQQDPRSAMQTGMPPIGQQPVQTPSPLDPSAAYGATGAAATPQMQNPVQMPTTGQPAQGSGGIPEDYLSLLGRGGQSAQPGSAPPQYQPQQAQPGYPPAGAYPLPNQTMAPTYQQTPAPQAQPVPQTTQAPVGAAGQMPAAGQGGNTGFSEIPSDFNAIARQSAQAADPNSAVLPGMPSAPKPLSPSLMADAVELNAPRAAGTPASQTGSGQGAAPALDALEALKARNVQRQADLRDKARNAATPATEASPQSVMPAPSAPETAIEGSQTDSTSDAVAIKALLKGLGFPEAAPASVEGERLAEDVGGMVRELATGLILLLSARKMVKSEFRIDETQVQPEENNPFKFFNIAELALDELLLTRKGGFQDPTEATRSAFEDLQQHTLVTMSAMQRAIKLLFERLSPDTLGQEGEDGGLRIRGLGSRKGKWETYVENHERMSGNIDNISRQIIAEAFAQVLEEHARQSSEDYWGKDK